ncbi:NAD(P)-dependent oxidoreductase [Agromyces sp. G08B096]|uniref:NAD(P)-dependent oxidoreductase n=1 Tax=Agromyces sp. G08B096 TaxID=3156399 RepID=A0AAU7W8C4_9MICO
MTRTHPADRGPVSARSGAVGFIGLGVMGEPMARNLVASGVDLVVWNRSAAALDRLGAAGARVASTAAEVFDLADVVLVMLATESAIDEVLEREASGLERMLRGRILVNLGTNSPAYAAALAADVAVAGGSYVEATVSGSRVPAEQRQLVGMLAGLPDAVERARAIVALLCAQTFVCGDAAPAATLMKLAVNSYLISMVTGLAEAFRFAEANALDLDTFQSVLDAGPMASPVSRVKLDKLRRADASPQARISDVLKNARLVVEAAAAAGVSSPLLDACVELYAATERAGDGGDDMIAVARAIGGRGA